MNKITAIQSSWFSRCFHDTKSPALQFILYFLEKTQNQRNKDVSLFFSSSKHGKVVSKSTLRYIYASVVLWIKPQGVLKFYFVF